MAIVAMLMCQGVDHDSLTPEQGNVYLTAVTNENAEYKEFFAYTPYAELRMGVLNQAAFSQMKPGKTYKMTLEQVD